MPYSQQDILTQNINTYPNNNSGQITPDSVKSFNQNWIQSVVFTDQTGSMVVTSASYAANAGNANTANSATSASFASTAANAATATSASYALTASFALNGGGGGTIATGSFATTGSNNFVGPQVVSGSLTIYNNGGDTNVKLESQGVTSNRLVVTSQVQASEFYGNLYGDVTGTSSVALTAATASYTPNAVVTASVSINTITFTKGNGSQFSLTVAQSGSVATASLSLNSELLDGLDSTAFASTSSFNSYTSSVSTTFATKAELNSYTGSTNAFTASMKSFTASINTFTGSVATTYATKAEVNSFTGSTNALTASLKSYTASINSWTGSNLSTFAGTASFASTAASIVPTANFTASNITVTNNLTVNGTASFAYTKTVTGSAVIIGSQYVILNADAPTQPYAGIKVYDTGSGTPATASFEWNGNNDYWITVEESGASAGILTGASGSKGSEVFPSLNKLTKGTGNNTIVDSNITDNGTNVSINSATTITGSLGVSGTITGTLSGTASFANNATSASYAVTAQQATSASYASTAQSATSASYASNAQTAFSATSASFATTASYAINVTQVATGSFATTGSNTFNGNQVITGSISTTGDVNVAIGGNVVTHHVKASAVNGVEIQNNTGGVVGLFGAGGSLGTTFYGQVNATAFSGSGALVTGVISSSYASNAGAAGSATTAVSASYASNAQTAFSATSASYAQSATSASYASTAQQATSASYASTAQQATSASFATSASYAPSSFDANALYSYQFLLMGA